jgi:hypothetical protein
MGSMDEPISSRTCEHSAFTPFMTPFIIALRSVNVMEGEPMDRQMTTGNHTVRDIYCCKCNTTLGWKYVSIHPSIRHAHLGRHTPRQDFAYEASQKYKEGKFILERSLLVDVQ